MGSYETCKTSCPEDHYSQYLNRLSGLILIAVMLYMTRVLTILFIRKWSQSNITALAITDAIRGSFREKLYQELDLESLQQRWWYRKLCYFFKPIKSKSPKYLFNNIPLLEVHTEQETLAIFLNLLLGILFLEIHTSHPL